MLRERPASQGSWVLADGPAKQGMLHKAWQLFPRFSSTSCDGGPLQKEAPKKLFAGSHSKALCNSCKEHTQQRVLAVEGMMESHGVLRYGQAARGGVRPTGSTISPGDPAKSPNLEHPRCP